MRARTHTHKKKKRKKKNSSHSNYVPTKFYKIKGSQQKLLIYCQLRSTNTPQVIPSFSRALLADKILKVILAHDRNQSAPELRYMPPKF